MNIGPKIKDLRKAQKMTLDQLSKASGIALATISRIENGVMVGTLESHMAIAKALGINLPQLYTELDQTPQKIDIQSKENRSDVFLHSDKSSYEILTTSVLSKKMMPILLSIEPFGKTTLEQARQGTEKFIFVLSGKIDVIIDEKKHTIGSNDTLYFDASLAHYYKNSGKIQAKIICVTTPPIL